MTLRDAYDYSPFARCIPSLCQVAHDRPGTSRNSYCVVLVNDVEAGRTGTIPRSCDPLWAANFYLSDEMLRKCTATSGKKQWGGKRTGTTNRCRGNSAAKGEGESPRSLQRGNIASVVIQVWDRVPEGEPALVGAANIPPDLLLTLLSSAPRSKYKSSDCATQAAALHTLDLRIWLQTDEEQLAHDVGGTARGGNRDSDGEIRDRDRTSEMCPSLVNATRGGDGERNRQGRAGEQPSSTGMLSLSLERRLASSAGLPIADYTYTKATHMSKEDTKGCEGSEQNMQSPALAKLVCACMLPGVSNSSHTVASEVPYVPLKGYEFRTDSACSSLKVSALSKGSRQGHTLLGGIRSRLCCYWAIFSWPS